MITDLNGRTAVITGGARGIGLTVARSLAADGAKIALLDLLDGQIEGGGVDPLAPAWRHGFQRISVSDR